MELKIETFILYLLIIAICIIRGFIARWSLKFIIIIIIIIGISLITYLELSKKYIYIQFWKYFLN